MIQFYFKVPIGNMEILKIAVEGFFYKFTSNNYINKYSDKREYSFTKEGLFLVSEEDYKDIMVSCKNNFQSIQNQYNQYGLNFQIPKNIIQLNFELEEDKGIYYIKNDIFVEVSKDNEKSRFTYIVILVQDRGTKRIELKSKVIPNLESMLKVYENQKTITRIRYGYDLEEQLQNNSNITVSSQKFSSIIFNRCEQNSDKENLIKEIPSEEISDEKSQDTEVLDKEDLTNGVEEEQDSNKENSIKEISDEKSQNDEVTDDLKITANKLYEEFPNINSNEENESFEEKYDIDDDDLPF